MSKGWYCASRIVVCAVTGVAVYILLQLLLAWLVVNGTMAESHIAGVQIMTVGIASLLAGFVAWKITGWRLAPVLTSIVMALLAITLGMLIYDGVSLEGGAVNKLVSMIVGGALSWILVIGKKSARKGRRVRNGRHK